MTVDGSRSGPDAVHPAGQSLEFVATFSTDTFEHAGFAITLETEVYAIFSIKLDGKLYARTSDGIVDISTHARRLPGNATPLPDRLGCFVGHVLRRRRTGREPFDGHRRQHAAAVLRLQRRSRLADGRLDAPCSLRLVGHLHLASSGCGHGGGVEHRRMDRAAAARDGALVGARFGNTAVPDATWTPFSDVNASGDSIGGISRYVQYQVVLTGDGSTTQRSRTSRSGHRQSHHRRPFPSPSTTSR